MEDRSLTDSDKTSIPASSRRRHVRLDAPEQLHVEIAGAPSDLRAIDISAGGMSIAAPEPLSTQTIHLLTVSLAPDLSVQVTARAVHCRRTAGGQWQIGLAFIEQTPSATGSIEDVLDAITARAITFG